ncbi:MAG: histidine ammonia-lyase [Saprospiraceae bacterium]
MNATYKIGLDTIDHAQIGQIIESKSSLEISPELIMAIEECRRYLDRKQSETDTLHYGINTGFGSLCEIRISNEEIEQLQVNLVRSHACGMGDHVPEAVVRRILLLKILSLSKGYSGVSLPLLQRLVDMYNEQIHPVIYQLGSLGASGDLSPLAHLSLPLIGEGELWSNGKAVPTSELWLQKNWQALHLQSKEGLALLNGTQFSTGYGVYCLEAADRLYQWANLIASASIDGFDCLVSPFDARIHQIRPHHGQMAAAADVSAILADSEIAQQAKNRVQDPYSFRCVPQVHGASLDVIRHVASVIEIEINSVTDNPNIFAEDDAILSGGNFHAQPIALALDYLAMALAELGSISERRIFQLISGKRDLPEFLCSAPGLQSGLMIPQYTAASIVSQNKQLCTPASVDSITSCMGQEDHVSMAANAATKCYRVVDNLERILAIEWMTACQAIHFRRPLKSSSRIERLIESYRNVVPVLVDDRNLHVDLENTLSWMRQQNLRS